MKEAGCGEGGSCKGRFVVVDMQERQYNKEQLCEENMRGFTSCGVFDVAGGGRKEREGWWNV
jgi:hypothetical protein